MFYGSDGTRTRDLRRDRPSRIQRSAATNSSEPPRLQVLIARSARPLRWVERIVQSMFGPRVGHEILSPLTTPPTVVRNPSEPERHELAIRSPRTTSCGHWTLTTFVSTWASLAAATRPGEEPPTRHRSVMRRVVTSRFPHGPRRMRSGLIVIETISHVVPRAKPASTSDR